MKKTVKKIMILGVALVILFLFTACGYPVDKFDSLEEMQAVLPKDMYYFDFEQEGIEEAGNFEASKTSNNKMEDGNYNYFRYSVWYDVEYTIGGQKQERKLRVIATDETHSMSFGYKNTEAYRSVINSILELFEIDGFRRIGWAFDENKNVLFLTVNAADHHYYYYLILEGVKTSFLEDESTAFLSICKFAMENKYQIT